jgi:hypothetical protein
MSAQILAGVGKADITCRSEGTQCELLSEKTRAHIPREFWDKPILVDDPLFVRALVLDNGERKIVLLTMDVTAVGSRSITQYILNDSADDFVPNLRGRIADEWGIPGSNVTVSASHTHPPGRLLADDDEQLDRSMAAIGQALASMTPVTVGVGIGRNEDTVNRTMLLKNGTDYTPRGPYPPPPDELIEGLRPVDPEIGVLRFDRLDGRPLAVVYNFACHLSLESPRQVITAGWPGVASAYLEAQLGGEAAAFFVQGALGDTEEAQSHDREQPKSCCQFGTALGESVLRAWRGIEPSGNTALNVISRTVEMPLRTDIPEVIAAIEAESAGLKASLRYTSLSFKQFLPLYLKHVLHADYPSHQPFRYLRADETGDLAFRTMDERNRLAVDKYLESLQAMEKMARNEENIATLAKHQEIIDDIGAATVGLEIQAIRIADSVFVTAPMEILAETGLKIKQTSPHDHTLIAAICNGYLHYSPPASYYPRGGYEVTECLLAPEWEAIFDATVKELLAQV